MKKENIQTFLIEMLQKAFFTPYKFDTRNLKHQIRNVKWIPTEGFTEVIHVNKKK